MDNSVELGCTMYDTIVAIATSQGESAIGIIRLSGEESFNILKQIFLNKSGHKVAQFESRKMTYGHIVDDGHVLDEVLVTYMPAPNTYTREDIVEINCHGGIVPIKNVLKLLLSKGARMAEPGEFTMRAFLNGRLDLAQAESVMDLISAKTSKGFDLAIDQLDGVLSKKVTDINEVIISLMSEIQVCIDYPEEDIEEITYQEILTGFNKIKDKISRLLSSSESGKIIREGLKTVIIGKPNVGKSSLMNSLLGEKRAIVTDIPGTTRDAIEEYINVKGIPLKIVDTAGIRETEDLVEKIGVEKSKAYFNTADLVIVVLNSAEALSKEDHDILDVIHDKKVIIIINKIDLPKALDESEIKAIIPDVQIVRTSIKNEEGLHDLEESIVSVVYEGIDQNQDEGVVSNVRHIKALENALESIEEAIKATEGHMPYDFIEVDLKNTFDHLGEITGETIEEDLVKKIFSSFCLGK